MRTITLNAKQIAKFDDDSPFLIESGDLQLKFIFPPQTIGEFFLVWGMAGKKKTSTVQIPKNGEIALKCKSIGQLEMCVKYYIRGAFVTEYKVDSLIVREVDNSITATPEIAGLRHKIELFEMAVDSLARAVKNTGDNATAADRKISAALLMYAYAAYRVDFQLNTKNLTLREFIKTLGIEENEFSDEEISEIEKTGGKL